MFSVNGNKVLKGVHPVTTYKLTPNTLFQANTVYVKNLITPQKLTETCYTIRDEHIKCAVIDKQEQ